MSSCAWVSAVVNLQTGKFEFLTLGCKLKMVIGFLVSIHAENLPPETNGAFTLDLASLEEVVRCLQVCVAFCGKESLDSK